MEFGYHNTSFGHKKTTGPTGIAAETFKGMESLGVDEVVVAFRKIANEGRIPASWKDGTTIAL